MSSGQKKFLELPVEELEKMFLRIRPVARFAKGGRGLELAEHGDLYFICVKNAGDVYTKDIRPGARAHNLVWVANIDTFHHWAAFVPVIEPTCGNIYASIKKLVEEEVLDEELADSVVAFEVDTRNVHQGHIDGNFIKAATKLYARIGRKSGGNRTRW